MFTCFLVGVSSTSKGFIRIRDADMFALICTTIRRTMHSADSWNVIHYWQYIRAFKATFQESALCIVQRLLILVQTHQASRMRIKALLIQLTPTRIHVNIFFISYNPIIFILLVHQCSLLPNHTSQRTIASKVFFVKL